MLKGSNTPIYMAATTQFDSKSEDKADIFDGGSTLDKLERDLCQITRNRRNI